MIVTLYSPPIRFMRSSLFAEAPKSMEFPSKSIAVQAYVYGGTPPEYSNSIVPSANSGQLTSVELILISNSSGIVINVSIIGGEQSTSSIISIIFCPGHIPSISAYIIPVVISMLVIVKGCGVVLI